MIFILIVAVLWYPTVSSWPLLIACNSNPPRSYLWAWAITIAIAKTPGKFSQPWSVFTPIRTLGTKSKERYQLQCIKIVTPSFPWQYLNLWVGYCAFGAGSAHSIWSIQATGSVGPTRNPCDRSALQCDRLGYFKRERRIFSTGPSSPGSICSVWGVSRSL